jgi:hypothetical protein
VILVLRVVVQCDIEYSVAFVNFFDLCRLPIRPSLHGLHYRVVLFVWLNLMW